MATRTNNNRTYYINPAYLTFNENSGYGANLIQVSASSSCWISVYDKANGIGYSDADKNYQRWKVTAYNNKFPDNAAYRIYVRLERNGTSALIVYSKKVYNVDGSSADTEASTDYYYIYMGDVAATDGTSIRDITYDTGYLESDQGYEDVNELNEMWELDKYSTPWLIKAKQWLHSFTVKGFISLIGGLIFKKGEEEKVIEDVKRSFEVDSDVPVSDSTIPTTKYVSNIIEDLDDRFLRKDIDDRSKGVIASDKGVHVGNFEEGLLGSGGSIFMRGGNSYGEVDYLSVRKKATFAEITIQELKHVGGEIILSPAAMICSRVEDTDNGWKCYFNTEDPSGRKIYQEFDVDDLARCQTFNLSPDGPEDLAGNHYYWRKVVSIGEDYIELSRTECDDRSDVPQEGDHISQLGNTSDSGRQAAIILSAYGADAPSYKQYNGIDGFSLEGKQVTKLSPYGNDITGKVTIEAGSSGWENLIGLPDSIQEALNMSSDAKGVVDNLEGGSGNLLRNTGFFGDYVSASLLDQVVLSETSEMYSPSLQHWTTVSATAIEMDESKSGKGVQILDGGYIQQRIFYQPVEGENYVVSFRGKGGSVNVIIGDYTKVFELSSDTFDLYFDKFVASGDLRRIRFTIAGDCELCEIQLEQGTIRSAWSMSPLDNQTAQAQYESLTYLTQAIENGSSEFVGGLGLANLMFAKDLENKITAGMSGIHNDNHSVAFFAGGDYKQAIDTALKYANDPSYQASESEIQNMAKYVVTHGGRAVLNDVVLRGYIYALGGLFKGAVEIASGKIKLNEDGSGQFADGGIKWEKNGVIYRKSNDVAVWSFVTDYTNGHIDFSYGTYINLTSGVGSEYILDAPKSDDYVITLKYQMISRSNECAILNGTFNILTTNDLIDSYTQVSKIKLSKRNKEYTLRYNRNAWYYDYTDAIIENGIAYLGRADVYQSDNDIVQGVSKSIYIYSGAIQHILTFENGILVQHSQKLNDGN